MRSEDNLLDFQLNETFNLLLPNEVPTILGQLGWDGTYATLYDGTLVQQLAYLSDLSGLGTGTVTSVSAGTGMSFTNITGAGSVAIDTIKVPYFSGGLSGTPSSTTYLRGDGVWATVSSGTIKGTIANTQIAYGTGVDTIGGSNNFTWDNGTSTLTVNGTVVGANTQNLFNTSTTVNFATGATTGMVLGNSIGTLSCNFTTITGASNATLWSTSTSPTLFAAGTSISIGANTGTATIRNVTVALTGGTLTGSTTQNLFNTTTSTLNAFGLVTNGNMFASVGALTLNVAHGATTTGVTKTINFGTGGLAGSVTNINIGSQLSNATNTGAVKIQNSLWVNSVSNAIHYLTVTNAITGNPVLISAGGATDVSIRLTPAGSGSLLTGNLSFNTNTIASSSQLLFTSSSATQFTVNNNNFSVGTGNNGAISFSSILASASSSLNSFTVNASNGTGIGAHKAVRIAGTLNNTSPSGTYDALAFEPTITAFAGQLNLITSTLASGANRAFIQHSGDAISNFGGNLNLTGSAKITTYAGLTTVSMGVAPIINDFSVTARTTAYTTQSLFNASATGLYELVITVEYASGSSLWVTGFQINYTNAGVASTHVIEPNYFTTQYSKTYVASIRCDSGTSVTFSTTLASATTHNIDILTKRLR